ncbi:MAG: ACT domain-containing protein [Candidatus Micrarchaeota archaeon]|nr:ACT domain-containing protein [Candidatus Micrarchaeota archaeon]
MTVSNAVRLYLKNRPYMIEALETGIANVSSVARVVQRKLGTGSHAAVKAAIRRYAGELRERRASIELRALPVLKDNRITLLDGISVIVSKMKLEIENDAEVKAGPYFVYLTRKPLESAHAEWEGGIVKVNENCSAIIISSGEKLENVPGVVAFLTSVLAENEINIVEFISCYTETIIAVRREDALRTYQLLSEITHAGGGGGKA